MSILALIVFGALLGGAAASDLKSYRIPNRLCLALAAGALVLAFPASSDEWVSRGGAFLAVSIVVLSLYVMRAMGGGDVKLLAAVSLWIPLGELPVFVLALGLAGGVQALVTMAGRRLATAGAAATMRRRMPYGVSIALAGWAWAAAAFLGR
ncbi:A24 family peptidase [Phenylobacterium sp.]|uniref:A24 family peptidase n=1 Tax=Phenylobacterium sp. TaxID=1871053 RepID=UPI002F93395E